MKSKRETLQNCGGIKHEIPKVKNGITELVFILDRSGSMMGLREDTVGGFNSMIERQKQTDGECYVSTVLFNGESEVKYLLLLNH